MKPESHDLRHIQQRVVEFSEARDWGKFHDPKSLSMAVAVEAGELMDHFRWVSSDKAMDVLDDPTSKSGVEDEVADVLILLLEFAHVTGIDLAEAVDIKLRKNGARYPIHLAKGVATKHDRLAPGRDGQSSNE
jgi:NTP pyrophosphatase (non-canonical NTP hydrolase)